ncbi:methylglyoxal synthase [Halodesulfovibrio sp.]|jgi:methylglyoxal synthase|uniref:methylglyoxal synthase n=1 Tax=Halodesulfovibrio sp. TaxID=1912772 RepID=UPI0025D65D74|nr:methylglyoxal synthase [Halodesulfovibrio sp.]MCT4534826.1 methylglyoxal synthase [Halodesulfovibrio sp.]
MELTKNIAIVAHDNCKKTMLEFVDCHFDILVNHNLFGTGTTGGMVEKRLQEKTAEAEMESFEGVYKMKSGPLGGDQQLGGLIAEGKIDVLIFFWDPMEPQPHDVDVKALLRLAVLYNIPTASNRSSADFLISSPLFKSAYEILDCGHIK